MSWEIVIHVGNSDLWPWVLDRLMHPTLFPRQVPVTITFSQSSTFQNMLQQAAVQSIPNVSLVLIENRGVDIGAFFQLLRFWKIKKKTWPTFVLKLHTKSDKHQRTLLWDQLLKYGPLIVEWMKQDEHIAIATTLACTIQQGVWAYNNNLFRMHEIFKRLGWTLASNPAKPAQQFDRSFPFATHFVLRMASLEKHLSTVELLETELRFCNTPYDLDTVWYCHPMVHPSIQHLTHEQAVQHYEKIGKAQGWAPNCFAVMNKQARHHLRLSNKYHSVMRDGMTEHAWERVFAYLGTLLAYDPIKHVGHLI